MDAKLINLGEGWGIKMGVTQIRLVCDSILGRQLESKAIPEVFWFSYLIFCWRTWFFLGVISVLFIILSLLVCLFGILVGVLGVLLGVLGVLHGVLGQFKFFSSDVQIYE